MTRGNTPKIIVSTSEEERERALHAAFTEQIHGWMAGVIAGVRYTPGVMRVLGEVLINQGVTVLVTAAAMDRDDDELAAIAEKLAGDVARQCAEAAKGPTPS